MVVPPGDGWTCYFYDRLRNDSDDMSDRQVEITRTFLFFSYYFSKII